MKLKEFLILVGAFLFVIILVGGAILVPFILPPKLVPEAFFSGEIEPIDNVRAHLQIDVRKSVLDWMQIILSAATASGVIITLLYTARNYRISTETLKINHYTKMSEAYIKAAELLGSNNKNITIGIITALGRLSLNSQHDQDYVIALLCGYARRTATYYIDYSGTPSNQEEINPEIQAIIDVIRSRNLRWSKKKQLIDLSQTNLCSVNLAGVDLSYAILEDCDLRGANFTNTKLRFAQMRRSNLENAVFNGTDLVGANLENSRLDMAQLVDVKFKGVILNNARGKVVVVRTHISDEQKRTSYVSWVS